MAPPAPSRVVIPARPRSRPRPAAVKRRAGAPDRPRGKAASTSAPVAGSQTSTGRTPAAAAYRALTRATAPSSRACACAATGAAATGSLADRMASRRSTFVESLNGESFRS
jgi:hypothetical protein